jgi:hypothetical protein
MQGTQELFVKDNSKKGGYRNKCRTCHNAKNEQWRADNPEKFKQCQLNYYNRMKAENKK